MKKVLVTGGTGTIGSAIAKALLTYDTVERIVLFSRDEAKQEVLARELPQGNTPIRFMLGDVRDQERLINAMNGVDTVIHTAAMKVLPKCEYDPEEAVKTNVIGSQNVINAAIKAGVEKCLLISTDKAVAPVNLYGATKLTAEKLFVSGNHLSGMKTKFSVVRYGNIAGSRGSVIPVFKYRIANNLPLQITDPRMTRFWFDVPLALQLIRAALTTMQGGEIFIPKMLAFKIIDLVKAMQPNQMPEVIGQRPGEKIHEDLLCPQESYRTRDKQALFVVAPPWEMISDPLPDGYSFSSNMAQLMTVDQLKEEVSCLTQT